MSALPADSRVYVDGLAGYAIQIKSGAIAHGEQSREIPHGRGGRDQISNVHIPSRHNPKVHLDCYIGPMLLS
jgi:hypothetical protein